MSKSRDCLFTPDWRAYEAAQETQQQSIDPTSFFGCNPYGNAAGIEELGTKTAPLQTKQEKTPDEQFKEDAGFFKETDEDGKPINYPLAQPIEYVDGDGKKVVIKELSGADLNLMGRAIFAESSGSQTVKDPDVLQQERNGIGSVILNRIGAKGLRGGRQDTVKGVLEAKNQFQSVTGGTAGKYQAGASYDAWKAYNGGKSDKANLEDLHASMDTVRGLLKTGPTTTDTSFVSSAYAKSAGITRGTDVGNTRFWKDDEVKR